MGDTGPCGPLHRNLLRPRRSHLGWPSRFTGRRMATASSRSGTWSSCSSTVRLTAPWSRCPSVRGYRHGSGAYLRHHAGRAPNYEIDIFQALIKRRRRSSAPRDLATSPCASSRPHPFLRLPGGDGVMPSNEGRLRAAPHHPPRRASRPQAGCYRRLLLQAGCRAGRR